MTRSWTFNQKVAAAFTSLVAVSALSGLVAVLALRAAVANKDRVIAVNSRNLADAAKLESAVYQVSANFRGYLLGKEGRFLDDIGAGEREVQAHLRQLQANAFSDDSRRLVSEISRAYEDYRSTQARIIASVRAVNGPASTATWESEALPKQVLLARAVAAFTDREEQSLQAEVKASNQQASWAVTLVSALVILGVAIAAIVAILLTRGLSRQIGSAVHQVQSSSTELQTAANQQASGAKESATAMNEIATTISELLATSRQIAESSRQVAHIAQETATASRTGDQVVEKTHKAIGGIRQQMDLVVSHMLDLGKKSQQIGGVLDIINELAEQTNILSINATIEAAGAGEAGKRFAVVGDEIRKLAERVSGSTKEVRALIEDIRSAVNRTVMATEGGSKAVDLGLRQFADVTQSFRQITSMVATATDAAREIELSTKQQTTAVEQVNAAIAGTAQATRETEASSTQTLQTATQLASLSRELSRIVQPQVRV